MRLLGDIRTGIHFCARDTSLEAFLPSGHMERPPVGVWDLSQQPACA